MLVSLCWANIKVPVSWAATTQVLGLLQNYSDEGYSYWLIVLDFTEQR